MGAILEWRVHRRIRRGKPYLGPAVSLLHSSYGRGRTLCFLPFGETGSPTFRYGMASLVWGACRGDFGPIKRLNVWGGGSIWMDCSSARLVVLWLPVGSETTGQFQMFCTPKHHDRPSIQNKNKKVNWHSILRLVRGIILGWRCWA
jgi:hypothetical protein